MISLPLSRCAQADAGPPVGGVRVGDEAVVAAEVRTTRTAVGCAHTRSASRSYRHSSILGASFRSARVRGSRKRPAGSGRAPPGSKTASRSRETALFITDVMNLRLLHAPITLLRLRGLRHRRYSAPSLVSRRHGSPTYSPVVSTSTHPTTRLAGGEVLVWRRPGQGRV